MARWRSRQTRRNRKLLLLGLAAALAASTFWYRSLHGHYPWSSGSAIADNEIGSGAPFVPNREVSKEPSAGDQPAPETASIEPDLQPITAGAHAAVVSPPDTNPATATTRPTRFRPAHPDAELAGKDADSGLAALQRGEQVQARELLSKSYVAGLAGAKQEQVREKMAALAAETLFSGKWSKDDPLTDRVVVHPGETLGGIAARYHIPQDFVAAINKIQQRNLIREGQRLKVIRGPFHATVSKREHVMDLYVQNVYVRSFRVALGMDGSTPTGTWKVANRQEDPGWADPRTGQRWHPSDPKNPIGEYWIGLAGIDGEAAGQAGYGIHGTIEPETIGKDVSMGCIRLAPDDIALLYKLLLPGESYIVIGE